MKQALVKVYQRSNAGTTYTYLTEVITLWMNRRQGEKFDKGAKEQQIGSQ